jgi:uncharacterized membrane protein
MTENDRPRIPDEETATLTKVPSRATIREHPIHPQLTHFPIAFLSGALLTDLVFWWTGDPFWARMSFWLVAGGFAMGVLAAIPGTTDFLSIRAIRLHPAAWSHFLAGVTLIAMAAANLMLRWGDPVGAVLPWGLFMSAISTVNLGVAGSLGGHLVYHYLIGTGEGQVEEAAEAKRGRFRRRAAGG